MQPRASTEVVGTKGRLLGIVVAGVLLAAAAVTACGSEELPDTTPTPTPTTTTTTPPPDAAPPLDAAQPPLDAARLPVDAGVEAAVPVDAAPIDAGPVDATVDATVDAGPVDAGSVTTSLKITTLAENCMPIVAKDPIRLVGSIDVVNTTPASVGPITATGGEIRDMAGNLRTRFDLLVPISVGPVPSGQTRSATYEKRPGTAVPALQCATLACNTDVVVSLTLSGAGTAGVTAKSGPVRVTCSF